MHIVLLFENCTSSYAMSFFGFETTLPRDKPKGIFDRKDPFQEVANARKLQALRGAQDEELVKVRRERSRTLLIQL